MKKLICLITILLLSCLSMLGQKTCNSTRCLFQKIENVMQQHYDYIEKNGIFEDPTSRNIYYFKTVQKIAPELFYNTYQYRNELLEILSDSVTFKKNYFTNHDISHLLCNMNIDDYADFLMQIYGMYKQGVISYQIFESSMSQTDPSVSNSVAKNYQNEKLIRFHETISQDEGLMNLRQSQVKSYNNHSVPLTPSEYWNARFGGKKLSEIQPPVLVSFPSHPFKDIPKEILQWDKIGTNQDSLLNCYESAYFNIIYEKFRDEFDFTGKKIGFITGIEGKTKSSKAGYFTSEKNKYRRNTHPNGGILYIFDETQKEESGGYDAAIVYETKWRITLNDALKRLRGQT